MTARAVIFDLFGTLIANYDRQHYYRVIENMGVAAGADPIEFRTIWREFYVDRLTGVHKSESANIRWVCDQLHIDSSVEQIEAANQIYLSFALPFLMTPREQAVETLTEIKKQGLKTGLLSDCGPWVPTNWNKSQFETLIDAPVFSSSEGVKKPNVSVYRISLQALDLPAEDCVYVADGNGDELGVAQKLGMRAIRIEPWNSEGSDPDADYSRNWDGESIESLGELLDLL